MRPIARLGAWHRWLLRRPGFGIRGAVALVFAITALPLATGISVAIDMSRLADGRAALQRAVDNAALSGAAAYSVNAQAAYTRALVTATSTFCSTAATMPAGLSVVASTGASAQSCNGTLSGGTASVAGGPAVTAQIAGYKAGTPGITASSCSATNPVVSGINCGFIVSVSAQATMSTMLPALIGASRTISVTGIAANPFINVGNAITAQILGSAVNTNSVWIYPLLLDANGNPDFTTNAGAVPGLTSGLYPADASPSGCTSLTACGRIGTPAGVNCTNNPGACTTSVPSGCTDSPTQYTCGAFTMLADTFYNTSANPCPASAPCTPNGAGNYPQFIAGVVQSPQAPAAVITATTPIGVAFESFTGGNQSYGYSSNLPQLNGCYYPNGVVYTTVSQVFDNTADAYTGGNPQVDWPKVTHWFYSSYLANGYPPSEGEILSQSQLLTYTGLLTGSVSYNTRIPTVGRISLLGIFTPPTALNTCVLLSGLGVSFDEFLTTTFPTTGSTNGSLFILKQDANSAYILPASTGYAGQRFTPANTPGAQYAALSCQSYGSSMFTFYWNDMSGHSDDLDYGNGSVRVSCTGPSFVILIQ